MPQLLKSVLCIIDTFHKYAREDGDKEALTRRELKWLLQDEIGDFVQPHVIHAVEKHLNLLDIDNDGTISFDEFILAIFSLLNLCYPDVQSLLNSEPRQVSKWEKDRPDDVDLHTTTRNDQPAVGTLPTQKKLVFSSETAASSRLSYEESEAVRHHQVDPWEGNKTHPLPKEASELNEPKNQHLEGAEQNKKMAQDLRAAKENEAQFETNKLRAGSKQTSNPSQEIPRERAGPTRRQNGTKISDHFGEQEENLKLQEEITQRTSEDQEVVVTKIIKKCSKTQESSLQGENNHNSEHVDMPEQAAARKQSETQRSANVEDDGRTSSPKDSDERGDYGRTSGTQESPAQENTRETKNQPVQHGSRNVSKTPSIGVEREEGKCSEVYVPAGQTEHERKIQPLALESQIQDGRHQRLSKERKAEKGSETQDLNPEERNTNYPETKEAPVPKEQVKHAEEGTAQAAANSKNSPPAKEAPGARERPQDSAPLEKQSEEENSRATKTHVKPAGEEGSYQGEDPESAAVQTGKSSCKTPRSLPPESGSSSSTEVELYTQGYSRSRVDPLRGCARGGHSPDPDPQEQVAPSKNGAQEAVVLSVRGKGVQLREEQEEPARRKHRSQDSGAKGPGTAGEPIGYPKAQESTAKGEHGKCLQAEVSAGLDTDLTISWLPTKGGNRRQQTTQGLNTKEKEDRIPEVQERPFESLQENKSASSVRYLEAEEPTTPEEENGSPRDPVGQGDSQQSPAKKEYSSVPRSGLGEKMWRDQESGSVERNVTQSRALYQCLQEKIQPGKHDGSHL